MGFYLKVAAASPLVITFKVSMNKGKLKGKKTIDLRDVVRTIRAIKRQPVLMKSATSLVKSKLPYFVLTHSVLQPSNYSECAQKSPT